MKKTLFLVILIVCIIFLTSCSAKTHDLILHEPADTVVQVDFLIEDSSREFICLYTLTGEEIPGFMDSLLQIKCKEQRYEPSTQHGSLVVQLLYSSGHSEELSDGMIIYRGETVEDGGFLYVPHEDLHYLCAEYVDASLLPRHPSIEN